ncbi:MAG TPA: hypothetical protein PLI09_08130 [Candidatus Hydrogenedentes bacterium]|nr:hypothetical protein [Candidatus Hydrogenedentota bacterium]
MRNTILAGVLVLLLIGLAGCPPQGPAILLTLRTTPQESGTVTAAPQQDEYAAGTMVTLSATPNTGWRFSRWEGVVIYPAESPTLISMDHSETVTAVFEPIITEGFQLTLDISPIGVADIITTPNEDPDTGMYAPGTVVTLSLEPYACNSLHGEFVRWEGDVSDSTSDVTSVTMDADKTVFAVFRPDGAEDHLLELKAEPAEGGTLTATPDQDLFFDGERATLRAEAATGWRFAFWLGDVTDLVHSETTITVLKDTTVTAIFVPDGDTPWSEYAYVFLPIASDSPLAEEIQNKFPNVVLGTGTVDGAVIMPGDVMDMALTQDQIDGIKQIYEAELPIVLFHVTQAQLAALEALLGIPPMGSDDPAELYAYYGINKEPEGRNWRLQGFYPVVADDEEMPMVCDASSDDPGCAEWRANAVAKIAAWIHDKGHRADVLPPSEQVEKALKSTAADWTSYATTDSLQTTTSYKFSDTGNSSYFTILTTPYTCHSLSSGYDYLYMYQQGTFNPSPGCYKEKRSARAMLYCETTCQATNFSLNPQITMIQPSPTTTVGEEKVTSGMSWNIGDSVGMLGKNGVMSISGGVSISRSESVTVNQITVLQNTKNFNIAYWKYEMKKPDMCKCDNDLCNWSDFSFNTLAITNQWIWVIQPSVRTTLPNGLPVSAALKVQITDIGRKGCNIFGCSCDVDYNDSYYPSKTASFTIPWAPIP